MAIPKKHKVNAAGVMAQLMAAQEGSGAPGAPTPPGAETAPEGLTTPSGAPAQSTPAPAPVAPPVSHVTKGMVNASPSVAKRPEKEAGKRPVGRPTLPHDGELVKKGFYIPTDVVEALRVRQFKEPDLTLSNHVVLALRQYLHMDEEN